MTKVLTVVLMRSLAAVTLAALAAGILLVQACTTLGPSDNQQAGVQPTEAMRAYIDPVTGKFTAPPPGSPVRVPADAAVSTSSQGLKEIPSQIPGGGVGIDLQGRFMSETTATVDADGNVKVRCLPASPQPKGVQP